MDLHFEEVTSMVKRMGWMRWVGLVAMVGMVARSGMGQTESVMPGPGRSYVEREGVAKTQERMTALRDAFVKATVEAGFSCAIAPPKVVVVDVPSFGNYEPETNTLKTPAWELMPREEAGIFYRLAGPGATAAAVRAEFETDAHQWIFVHEMGHWWQACRGVVDQGDHWAIESGANRIAAAYWRERDATVVPHMRGAFEMVLKHAPNPVPAGQEVKTYFNANYQTLGPSPAYPWFQSKMCVTVMDETPMPSFAEVLGETKPSGPER